MRRIATVALMAICAGCSSPGAQQLHLHENVGRLSEALTLNLRSEDDSWVGGARAVALTIEFENVSDGPLSGCQMWLGDALKASFSDLEVYRGFFGGNRPRGRSDLRPGEGVTFAFNHDNNNYRISVAGGGGKAFNPGIPPTLTLVCGERRAEWRIGA
jgi:hypothetical protein